MGNLGPKAPSSRGRPSARWELYRCTGPSSCMLNDYDAAPPSRLSYHSRMTEPQIVNPMTDRRVCSVEMSPEHIEIDQTRCCGDYPLADCSSARPERGRRTSRKADHHWRFQVQLPRPTVYSSGCNNNLQLLFADGSGDRLIGNAKHRRRIGGWKLRSFANWRNR